MNFHHFDPNSVLDDDFLLSGAAGGGGGSGGNNVDDDDEELMAELLALEEGGEEGPSMGKAKQPQRSKSFATAKPATATASRAGAMAKGMGGKPSHPPPPLPTSKAVGGRGVDIDFEALHKEIGLAPGPGTTATVSDKRRSVPLHAAQAAWETEAPAEGRPQKTREGAPTTMVGPSEKQMPTTGGPPAIPARTTSVTAPSLPAPTSSTDGKMTSSHKSDTSKPIPWECSSGDGGSLKSNNTSATFRKRKRMSSSNDEGVGERGEEEQVEDEAAVLNKRKRFKQSEVDDESFNLDEMHHFCEAEERKEASSSKGKKKGERTLGDFEAAEEMGQIIQRFEEENLEPRSWELAGEATGEQRERDELLDDYVEVDFRAQPPPSINADHTARLEAIIKQRIKDRAFDDPVCKYRQDESASLVPTRRGRAQAEAAAEQGVRKSLAEIYEERFQRDQQHYEEEEGEGEKSDVVGAGGERAREVVEEEVHIDPTTEAIDKDMMRLFAKLDALAHFQFKPPEIKPELTIVSNMASLRVEEVGPIASTSADSQLLAPSEVFMAKKGVVKAKEERSTTDKKRERRKKKKKQRAMAAMGLLPPKDSFGSSKRAVRFAHSKAEDDLIAIDEAMNEAEGMGVEKKKKQRKKREGEKEEWSAIAKHSMSIEEI